MADTHRRRLLSISIESILDAVVELAPELSWWTTSFRRRYVDLSPPTRFTRRKTNSVPAPAALSWKRLPSRRRRLERGSVRASESK